MSSTEFNKYINSPAFKELLQSYESALRLGDNVYFDLDDLLDIAEYYHITGNYDAAERAIEYCRQQYPDEGAPLLFKARMSLIDYDDCEYAKDIMKEYQGDINCLEAIYIQAEVMLAEGETAEADAYLEEKYQELENNVYDCINYNDDDYEISDFALDVAMIYCDRGYFAEAKKWIDRVHEPSNDNIEYYDTLARILMSERKWKEAEGIMETIISMDAYNLMAWLMIAETQFNQQRHEDAIQSIEYAIAIAPNSPDPYLTRCNCYYAMGQMENAERDARLLLTLNPNNILGESLLVAILYAQEKYSEIAEHIETAIENIPPMPDERHIEALNTCALAAAGIYDEELAMKCCDAIEPYVMNKLDIHMLRGCIYSELGVPQKTLEYFAMAAEIASSSPMNTTRLAFLFYKSKIYPMALQTIKSLLAEAEKNDNYESCPDGALALAAAVCKRLGMRADYLRYLKYATMYTPDASQALLGEFFPVEAKPEEYLQIEQNNSLEDDV